MSNTVVNIELNGDTSGAVKEWEDIEFIATFENDNAQPNITVNNELTFVNEYAVLIQQWIDGGYISEGIPITFNVDNSTNTYDAFQGIVDLRDRFERIDPTTFKASIKPSNGLNRLADRSSGLTFQFLFDEGYITTSDFINVPYVVEKELNFIDMSLLTLGIFLMIDKLQQLIKELSKDVANLTAHIAGGATGAAAAIVAAATLLALDIAYTAIVLVALVDMIRELISYVLSPVKFHKAIRLNTLLEAGADYLGYNYNSTITELEDLVYMPSKREIVQDTQVGQLIANLTINQPGLGIPSSSDYGYIYEELLDLVNRTFAAKVAIKNNTIEQHALISNWWIQQSSYTLPPVLTEQRKYNVNELIGTRLLKFQTDQSDYWTIENYDGTISEIRSSQTSAQNNANVQIKGIDKTELPVALGTRKDGLNVLENKLYEMALNVDKLINFLGGNGNWANKVIARVGMLKLGKDWFDVPKLMKMNSANKLSSNYRTNWSAPYLYDNYHSYYSFTGSNPNQWLIFEDVKIPFGFVDFLNVINNSYFYDSEGNECKIDQLIWSPNKDYAKATWKQRETYTTNITETQIT